MRIHEQAKIQLQGRREARICYELLQPPEPERGLCALPLPSPNDLFLDFESSPYYSDEGLEYLAGWVTETPDHREPAYEAAVVTHSHGRKKGVRKPHQFHYGSPAARPGNARLPLCSV